MQDIFNGNFTMICILFILFVLLTGHILANINDYGRSEYSLSIPNSIFNEQPTTILPIEPKNETESSNIYDYVASNYDIHGNPIINRFSMKKEEPSLSYIDLPLYKYADEKIEIIRRSING